MTIQIDFADAFTSARGPIVEVIEQPSGRVVSKHRVALDAHLDALRRNARLGNVGADSRHFTTKARGL